MKLRTRLIVAFAVMLFVPIFLMSLFMMTVGNRELERLDHYEAEVTLNNNHAIEALDTSAAGGSAGERTLPESTDRAGGRIPSMPRDQYDERVMTEVRDFLQDMALVIMVILMMTATMLLIWIYTGINVPLIKLRKATKNITEGNLNFTLEVSGDDEISDLCRDFEEMRKRLRETTEEKLEYDRESKELISNISHDLKTPITAIKGYVEGIMDGVADTPEKMDRYIRTIYNKANEMDRLINELTFYSKIDTNRIPYVFNKINAADYFEDCCEELGLELEAKGFHLSYENTVDRDVEIIADAEQLKRVINNIVGNSVKYMDKPVGEIGIRLKDVGDFVQIEIEDNGQGIGPKELPQIFERFYRTDASRNLSKGGSGIGLSIVRKIIEDHGGKIWASSIPGSGTVMYFVLRKYQEVPV